MTLTRPDPTREVLPDPWIALVCFVMHACDAAAGNGAGVPNYPGTVWLVVVVAVAAAVVVVVVLLLLLLLLLRG